MDARQSRRGKRISLQQEKRAAADLGGKTMAASGATRMGGGADVRVMGNTRLECKFTENDRYTLKFEELEKLRKQATKTLEFPVMQFAFRETTGRFTQYAVIPWDENVEPTVTHTVDAKSLTFHKSALTLLTSDSLWQVVFHVKEGNYLKNRYFRLMRWDDFLERSKGNA